MFEITYTHPLLLGLAAAIGDPPSFITNYGCFDSPYSLTLPGYDPTTTTYNQIGFIITAYLTTKCAGAITDVLGLYQILTIMQDKTELFSLKYKFSSDSVRFFYDTNDYVESAHAIGSNWTIAVNIDLDAGSVLIKHAYSATATEETFVTTPVFDDTFKVVIGSDSYFISTTFYGIQVIYNVPNEDFKNLYGYGETYPVLIGSYLMRDGSGSTITDLTGNAGTATISGSPTWNSASTPSSLTLTGADYITIPKFTPATSPGFAESYTITLWAKLSAYTDSTPLTLLQVSTTDGTNIKITYDSSTLYANSNNIGYSWTADEWFPVIFSIHLINNFHYQFAVNINNNFYYASGTGVSDIGTDSSSSASGIWIGGGPSNSGTVRVYSPGSFVASSDLTCITAGDCFGANAMTSEYCESCPLIATTVQGYTNADGPGSWTCDATAKCETCLVDSSSTCESYLTVESIAYVLSPTGVCNAPVVNTGGSGSTGGSSTAGSVTVSESSSESDLSGGQVAGIVIGVIGFVIVSSIVGILVYKHYKNKRAMKTPKYNSTPVPMASPSDVQVRV